ncbi:MAG: RsiV family protein [Bacteroidota bacterium]
MKPLPFLFILIILLGCKNDPETSDPDVMVQDTTQVTSVMIDSATISREDLDLEKEKSIVIKQQDLINKKDEKDQLEELLIEKTYLKEEDAYTIDFRYPLLNEKVKESYVNFNEYINDYYVDITGTEAGILEDKELICDTVRTNRYREKRFIDYKVYNLNDQLVSVLFYKENFYSGTLHPTYSFDCMNFDLNRSVFMNYDDFFNEGSEEELRKILNEVISSKINSGEMYYDCWEISEEDFWEYKDNFVLDDTAVEYYFDDCVVCPSYTGSYSVRIPLEELLPVLRRYDINPLVF